MRSPVWITVIIAAFLAAVGVCLYILLRRLFCFLGADVKKKRWILADLLCIAGLLYFCTNIWSLGAVLVLHLAASFVLLELISLPVRLVCRRLHRKVPGFLRILHQSGLGAFLIAAAVLLAGVVNMKTFVQTEYVLESDKLNGSYRVVLITDTHYGTIQSKDLLWEAAERIETLQPDLVLLGGDIVEEGTSKADMEEVFSLFGKISARYGVFYVYGNHDRQPHAAQKAYTAQQLKTAIETAGITILEDTAAKLGEELVLAGRADARWNHNSGRKTPQALLSETDRERYVIVADHQPIEAQAVSDAGADLMVSGHTHAGQIWPVGLFTSLTGGLNYGLYQYDGCQVIVSSGFTGWGYPVRTQGRCEYVVIDIHGKEGRIQ